MALCPPHAGRFGPRRGWRFARPAPGSSPRAGDGALPPPPRVVRPTAGMAVAHSTPFLRPAAGSGPFPTVRRAGGLATKNCATPLSASCEFFLGQLPLPRLHLLPPLPRFSLLGCVFRRLDAAPAAPRFSFPRLPLPLPRRRPRRSRLLLSRLPLPPPRRRPRRSRLLLPRLPLPSPRRRPRRCRLLPSPASSSPPSHLPPPQSSRLGACSLSSGGSTGRKNSCQKSSPSLWACQGPGVISMLLPPFARPIPLTFLRE